MDFYRVPNPLGTRGVTVEQERIINVGLEVGCERSPLKSVFEDNPTLMVNPISINVDRMKHDTVRNYPLSKNFKADAVNSSTKSRCLEKMDTSENHSAQGSLLYNTSSLGKVTDAATSNNKAISFVNCHEMTLEHVGASSFPSAATEVADKYPSSLGDKFDTLGLPVNFVDDNVAQRSEFSCLEQKGNCELQGSRSYQKRVSSSSRGVKCKSWKNKSISERYPDKKNLKNVSSNLSVAYGKGSDEVPSCSGGMVLSIKSKGEQNNQYVIDVKNKRNEASSQVGTCDQRKNKDADVSSKLQVGQMGSDLEAKLFKSVCLDSLDLLSTTNVGVGCPVNASTENFKSTSSVIDLNKDTILSRTSMKDCQYKKKNVEAKSYSRFDAPDNEDYLNAAAVKQGTASKETCMTWNKSKGKLTSGSSRHEMAKSQRIASPESAKSTSRLAVQHTRRTAAEKGSRERNGSANIMSPESFSGKRSRSGRLLLPVLEFWRNQTVVYDANRQVTGIQEGTYMARSSRDTYVDDKTFKKKGRRASKP